MPLSKSFAPPVPTPGAVRFEDVLACLTAHGRPVDSIFLRAGLRVLGRDAQGPGPPLGRALHDPPAQRRLAPGRPQVRPDLRGRRAAPRRPRRHPHHPRGAGDRVRRRGRRAGRRRHQDRPPRVRAARRGPGRDLPQDDPGLRQGHPRHRGQARRPAPQHADPGAPGGRGAAAHLARDAGDLLPDRPPPGHGPRQGRPGGSGLLPPLPPSVRRAPQKHRREDEGGQSRPPSASATGSPRALEAAGIDAEISFRVKRYYSIYEKLRRQGIDISQLYDYLAFRIVTGSLKDTYAALGIVHQNWRPIPGRFKDYIAMPKPNLYQSLHTTVVGDQGQPFEVQIRTSEMDVVAEEGIAAHWRYKEGQVEAAGQRSQHPLDAPAPGVAEGSRRPAHVHDHPEGRPLSRRGLRLHAQRSRLLLPARGDAARLRLPGAHRLGPPLRRRAGQRQARAAPHPPPERRHDRDPFQPLAQPEPRLAQPGRHLAGQEQDPPVAQHPAEAARHGDRPPAFRQRDPQVRPVPAQDHGVARAAPRCSRPKG